MKQKLSLILAFFAIFAVGVNLSGCGSLSGDKTPAKQAGKSDLPDEPSVTFEKLEGGTVPLASFKGKVVLVNFWATWCEPCRIEIPWMIGFQQKYGARGFTVIGVAMDDEGRKVVEPFAKGQQFDADDRKVKMNYPIMLGSDETAQKFGGLIGLPTSVLISRDGKIVKRFIGLVNHDMLDKEIQGLL